MIKLYKKDGAILHYWEAWDATGQVTIHWGTVGTRGSTRIIRLSPGADGFSIIQREAGGPRREGYEEIESERLTRVVIQFRIDGMGTIDDLKKRQGVEDQMNECLGWLGLGHCDGGDIGSGTMNVFCFVVDESKAVPVILDKLRSMDYLDESIVAVTSHEKERVAWPLDFQRKFSI